MSDEPRGKPDDLVAHRACGPDDGSYVGPGELVGEAAGAVDPGIVVRIEPGRDGDIVRRQSELVGDDLRHRRLVPAIEAAHLAHLTETLGIKGVRRVMAHSVLTGMHKVIVIQFEKGVRQTEIWRALYSTANFRRIEGKWVIAVDTDIDGYNGDAILWAIAFRCKPHRDMRVLDHQDEGHGPRSRIDSEDSAVLINAVLKEPFSPVAMPKREYI